MPATVPNIEWWPEQTRKYFAGFQHYFQPAVAFSVGTYAIQIRDKQVTGQPATYSGDRFVTALNDPDERVTKGIEVEYNQRLTFLPGPLKKSSMFGNASRVTADGFTLQLVPKSAGGGIKLKHGRFRGQVRTSWNAARAISRNAAETIWMRERTSLNVNVGWQLRRGMQLFISGRNLTQEPWEYYSRRHPNYAPESFRSPIYVWNKRCVVV